jgi:hypothetical protein
MFIINNLTKVKPVTFAVTNRHRPVTRQGFLFSVERAAPRAVRLDIVLTAPRAVPAPKAFGVVLNSRLSSEGVSPSDRLRDLPAIEFEAKTGRFVPKSGFLAGSPCAGSGGRGLPIEQIAFVSFEQFDSNDLSTDYAHVSPAGS